MKFLFSGQALRTTFLTDHTKINLWSKRGLRRALIFIRIVSWCFLEIWILQWFKRFRIEVGYELFRNQRTVLWQIPLKTVQKIFFFQKNTFLIFFFNINFFFLNTYICIYIWKRLDESKFLSFVLNNIFLKMACQLYFVEKC